MTPRSYAGFDAFPAFAQAQDWISGLVAQHAARDVLEIGAGANPTIGLDRVTSLGIRRYTSNDVSAAELAKAPRGYDTLCCDFTDPAMPLEASYDFIFSRLVNEHVRDGEAYYRNIFRALKPGGVTVHAFSTLYALPFVVNRCVPEFVSSALLNFVAPRDRHQHGKFRAYYSWSRGPTRAQLRRFARLGFEVLEYRGFFGHRYYQRRFPLLHRLELLKEAWLVEHPVPQLTAYASVILRRPLGR